MKQDKKEKLVRVIIFGSLLFLVILTPMFIVSTIKSSFIMNYPLKLKNSIILFLICVVMGLLIDEILTRKDKK